MSREKTAKPSQIKLIECPNHKIAKKLDWGFTWKVANASKITKKDQINRQITLELTDLVQFLARKVKIFV